MGVVRGTRARGGRWRCRDVLLPQGSSSRASRKREGEEAATLDDVVEVLGNLLDVATAQGKTLDQHGVELRGQREELRGQREELRLHRGLLEHVIEEQT